MRALASLVVAATVVSMGAPSAMAAPSSIAIERELNAQGATATVNRLGSDYATWDAVIRHIARGEPAWLRLAPRLRRGSDAATSETLDIAIGQAIVHNPAGVLKLDGPEFPLADICHDNRIEPTAAQVRAFRARAVAALRAVREPALRARRDTCLRVLEAS